MSNWMISLFFAVGAGGWIYTKLVRSNGNAIPSQNVIGAIAIAVAIFILFWTFLEFILKF